MDSLRLDMKCKPEDRLAAQQLTAELLQQPLSQKNAVHLTLVHSPALQSLLAESWVKAERTVQSARITNPLFSSTRLRMKLQKNYLNRHAAHLAADNPCRAIRKM